MKLFIYRGNRGSRYGSIHANDEKEFRDYGTFICGQLYNDKIDKFITGSLYSRPFCVTCTRLLKKENVNMKQLAINQKLGIKC